MNARIWGLAATLLLLGTGAVRAEGWHGFYAGLNGGYGYVDGSTQITGANPLTQSGWVDTGDVASIAPHPKGFVGGGQLGYNWQVSPTFVVGLETDLAYADIDESTVRVDPLDSSREVTTRQQLDSVGTLRGRVGFLPTETLLTYVTGGFAYGQGKLSTALTRTPSCSGNNCQNGSLSKTLTGWTIGGGVECAFAKNLSAKLEYLYVDLGSASHRMTDPAFPATIFDSRADFTGGVVRVGLNYSFD